MESKMWWKPRDIEEIPYWNYEILGGPGWFWFYVILCLVYHFGARATKQDEFCHEYRKFAKHL
jgi:hypothetical protein